MLLVYSMKWSCEFWDFASSVDINN